MGEDDAFGVNDFLENAPVRVVGAIGAVHDMYPCASGPDVHLLDGRCKAARSPPLDDVPRVGHGLPCQFAWRIERAGNDDLAVGGWAGHV
jgi:hypothetical protein